MTTHFKDIIQNMLSICRTISSLAEHTRNAFHSWLSIQGNVSSLAEHARKCLKVENLGRIEYDFQKSCVTGPWDHKVSVSTNKSTNKFHACVPLKGLKLEIFRPVWISVLGTGPKISKS
jgi:hypothetical protein